MNMSRSLVSKLNVVNPILRSNLVPVQRRTIISGPPSVRISLAEKAAHMGVMIVGMLAIPLYILSNVRRYREKS